MYSYRECCLAGPSPSNNCVYYHNQESGSFTDGSSRSRDYNSNMACLWVITPGYRGIKLTFGRFDLEQTHDTLKVYDAEDQVYYGSDDLTFLRTYTGSTTPSPLIVQSRAVYLWMQTDGSVEYTGFYVSYSRAESPPPPRPPPPRPPPPRPPPPGDVITDDHQSPEQDLLMCPCPAAAFLRYA